MQGMQGRHGMQGMQGMPMRICLCLFDNVWGPHAGIILYIQCVTFSMCGVLVMLLLLYDMAQTVGNIVLVSVDIVLLRRYQCLVICA